MQPGGCSENPGPFDPALDIYIDDSGSMRGFATRQESNYLRVLQGTLLAATAAPFDLNVYPLSSNTSVPPAPISQFSKASFYEKPDTPLVDLVSRIAQKPDHTAIVISDLVQSERQQNRDIQALIRVLRQLVEMRSEIRLFAFRSDFIGDYYPESQSKTAAKLAVDTSQSVPGAGRPFYLLVIAPNSTTMDKLSDYIVSRLYPANSFNPVYPAFEIHSMELTPSGSIKPGWTRYSKFLIQDTDKRIFETSYAVVDPDTHSERIDLPVTVAMSRYAPMRTLEKMEINGKMASWNPQSSEAIPVTIPVSGVLSAESMTVQLRLMLKRPAPLTWDVYRLSLRPGPGNLSVPAWVRDWSTDDDSSASEANKTYRLGLLVQTMENAISERQLCSEWFLKVNGGK
jgi:hypothetical protein